MERQERYDCELCGDRLRSLAEYEAHWERHARTPPHDSLEGIDETTHGAQAVRS